MQPAFLSASSFEDLAQQIPPELLAVFLCSLKFGFWPDGSAMTDVQKETCERTLAMRGISRDQIDAFAPLSSSAPGTGQDEALTVH
ncbi:MAG: hypothetical protein AAF583_07415 [Pseudomonadota bacterium]